MFVGTTKGRHKWIIKKRQWNRNEMFTQPSLEISTSSVDTFLIRKSIDSLPKRFKWLSVHIGLNCATFYCFSSSRNSYLLIFFFGSIFEERYKVNSNIDLPRGFCIAERSFCAIRWERVIIDWRKYSWKIGIASANLEKNDPLTIRDKPSPLKIR